MGPPPYLRSVVDRIVVMRRILVYGSKDGLLLEAAAVLVMDSLGS